MESSSLFLKIRKETTKTVKEYQMIEDGDRILVAVSGGKDSTLMLLFLESMRKKAKINFSLYPLLIDQRQPHFAPEEYQKWLLDEYGIKLNIVSKDTYSIVVDKTKPNKSFCGLCSRLRRGILYNYAFENGYNKIALGHHQDDLNETLLLNLFFSGRLASMPPKLTSDDGRNQIIRPLSTIKESDLAALSQELQIPVMPCNLCNNQKDLKRVRMKKILRDLEKEFPSLPASMLTAQQNLRPSQLADLNYL